MTRPSLACLGIAVCLAFASPSRSVAAPDSTLGVSPMLMAAASDVWSVIAKPDNPVWPGWTASETPLLLYLPGREDLLINHPKPPEGFRPYDGPLKFPGAQVLVKHGPTLIGFDGQNTAMDVGGVRTLVVADPLSNLRQRVGGLIEDPRPAAEKTRTLEFESLTQDPYDQLGLVVHEAFHVYQNRVAPDRGGNEMFLLFYPVLSVDNNLGFGLEAQALSAALEARDDRAFREAAVRWLAVRLDRRAKLPARAIEYEDGTEFNEGLAKYTEYRLFQVLEGRTPAAGLTVTQGFHGYGDLSRERADLVREMKRNLRGEVNINNDPYGTAPARFRLYYSGMAVAAMLDRLSPDWKRTFMAGDSSLTALARDAIRATPAELASALAAVRADTAASTLRAAKQKLALDGKHFVAAKLAKIESGPGTMVVIDYSALDPPKMSMSFSPFGINAVDSVRTIFEQVPIGITFSDQSQLSESIVMPVLRDTRRRQVSLRLEKRLTRAELEKDLGRPAPAKGGAAAPAKLELPGVTLDLKNASVAWDAGVARIKLLPTR